MIEVTNKYKEEALEVAKMEEVAAEFGQLKKSGASMLQDCPQCAGKWKLTITPGKGIWKCFRCDIGGNNAVSYLMAAQDMTYPDAMEWIGKFYGLDIPEYKGGGSYPSYFKKNGNTPFFELKLFSSGISRESILYKQKVGDHKWVEATRFTKGSIGSNWEVVSGDDMIIHYLDFDYSPIMYSEKGKKKRVYIRVRYKNPSLHPDKAGRPVKYRTPPGGGNHLYIPNEVIRRVTVGEPIHTLVICEGELKAEKLTQEGVCAVAISGIHNLARQNEMPHRFQRIISDGVVKNVILLLDSDLYDLSTRKDNAIDLRPRTFASAVIRYRDYFYAYTNQGIFLNIYFGHHVSTAAKGIDDLLTTELREEPSVIAEDINRAIVDREGKGEYVQMHKVTNMSDYKIKELFHVHNKAAFIEHYRDVLLELRVFKVGKLQYYVNDEGEIEVAQKMLPHEQYWVRDAWEGKNGKERVKYRFRYQGARIFLRNRGYGVLPLNKDVRRLIKLDGKIVSEISPVEVQEYMLDFTEEMRENEVLELLLAGGFRYFGAQNLNVMYPKKPEWIKPDPDVQYMYFNEVYWKITADGITKHPLSELPGHIWKDQIIDFSPELNASRPIFSIVEKGGDWKINSTAGYKRSDIAKFIEKTSMNFWKKIMRIEKVGGEERIVERSEDDKIPITKEDFANTRRHIVSKMLAAGYVLCEYKDLSQMRAIIAMDGVEAPIGTSNGGTGKSIFTTMFEHLMPIHVIDAKKKKLTEDPHLYEEVNERTKAIVFDDCRVNLDFEFFLSQITRAVTVNPKGLKRFKVEPPPVFLFATNHSVNDQGASFQRRQYLLSFYDYFNHIRTPKMEFGHLMFEEWDYDQWNLFYNYMACCVQSYLKYGLRKVIDAGDLNRRKLRQQIGETLLQWLQLKFSEESEYRNKEIEKYQIFNAFVIDHRREGRYLSIIAFKRKLKAFAEYSGLDWNPQKEGKDIKKGSKEYICIADDRFNIGDVYLDTFS